MVKKILKIFLFFILSALLILVGFYITAPDGSEFRTKNPRTTALIEKRKDEYRRAGKKVAIKWQWVPISQISPYFIQAVILAEDARFYQHPGFDVEAMKYALEKNIKRKKFAVGGSTITQQLARNLYLSPKKSLFRKFRELLIAYKLDKTLSKHRILELYLNVIELGRGIYGVEAASQTYFGKSAAALNVEEASSLVAIMPNPRRHQPLDGTKFTERRRTRLLNWMFKTGRIDSLTYYRLTEQGAEQLGEYLDSTAIQHFLQKNQQDSLSDSLSESNGLP